LYVSASSYSMDELAEVYNAARVDYIVPMPMNGKRMADYIRDYDIDLSASLVSLTSDGEPNGINMMGLRDTRAWVTRLGVIPERRGHKVGQGLMEACLNYAANNSYQKAQLEVIKGNEPARRLFLKLGFTDTRELLVVRRPPVMPHIDDSIADLPLTTLETADLAEYLTHSEDGQAWTEEIASFRHLPGLHGFTLTLPSGEFGWLIFQLLPFQLTHLTFAPGTSPYMAYALLYHLHHTYPKLDAKVENVPVDHNCWEAMQHLGYLETFRRIEMVLSL